MYCVVADKVAVSENKLIFYVLIKIERVRRWEVQSLEHVRKIQSGYLIQAHVF